MFGRVLLLVFLTVPAMAGCGFMQRPPLGTFVDAADSSHDRDGWLAGARRRFSQVAGDIKADLDFHDNEGLEQFAPDAVEQVRALRGDMNGPSDITR